MKTLALLLALLPATAMAGELPFRGTFCSHSLRVSNQSLSMPEVGCNAPTKAGGGYVAQCPTSEVGKIAFTLTKQPDGSFLYADNYWGKEVLHSCN